ncbi:unnamed protein product [Durusdinium trenchii]|uniref:2-dehydro-3-deoxy-phosphogluconate aldolase n=1 Tax=Durusdinium trenchii TaxID=1381693 RepID=A0ABP0JDC1_9DINO
MTDKCKTLLAAAAVGALAGAIAAAGVVFATKRKKLKNQAFLKAELELEQKLRNVRVVPVLGLDGVEKADSLARALVEGGFFVIEVIFRPSAEDSLRLMSSTGAFVGAGTVLTAQQAASAVKAGAKFITTLGLNKEVADWCLDHAIPVIPGVASPSEVEQASRNGFTMLKFFPAEANGGPAGLKAVATPYPHLTFYPTGGVSEKNLQDYLSLSQVVAVGGTWIAPQDLIASENFELLSTLAHSTLQVVRGNVGLATSGKVATASIDHTARLWSIETGECLMSFLGHEDQVMSVAFSPDGELLATASTDKTAKLWLCDSGQCAVTCVGHSGPVYTAFFSPDGCNLLTASHDRTVKIWDTTTGECERTIARFDRTIHSAVYSPDGKMIATATDDHEVIIWNAAKLQQVQKISNHSQKVFSVQFSHDNALLLTASMDGSARIAEIETGSDKIVITGHNDWLRCAAFSPDSLKVVTASGDGKAKTWSAVTGKPLLDLAGHADWLRMAAFSVDGGLIVTASKDGTAKASFSAHQALTGC